MILYSKANLTVVDVAAKPHGRVPGLNCVHFSPDGATVAADGQVFLAVEPANAGQVHFPDVGGDASIGPEGVNVPSDIVHRVRRNIPRDKRVSLQHCAMTRNDEKVEFTTTDQRKEQRVACSPVQGEYPRWKSVLRKARQKADRGRICVNRRALRSLLEAMDAACPDKAGDHAIFIEVGGERDSLVLRAVNHETGQHAVGMVSPLDTGGRWLKPSKWEQGVLKISVKRRKRAR